MCPMSYVCAALLAGLLSYDMLTTVFTRLRDLRVGSVLVRITVDRFLKLDGVCVYLYSRHLLNPTVNCVRPSAPGRWVFHL
jgi:hypothetical protein